MKADIRIKNGRIIDPALNLDELDDVFVSNGRIVSPCDESDYTVDASDCVILPGLIDYHAHIFTASWEQAIPADSMLAHGVTSVVDAGSAGWENFGLYYNSNVRPSKLTVKSYLNVSPTGMDRAVQNSFNEAKAREVIEKYSEQILGIKLLISHGSGSEGLKAFETVLDFIERNRLPLRICAHTTSCPIPIGELAQLLRSGDVLCHCYQGERNTAILLDGGFDSRLFEAQKRGVIFDAAIGRGNFSYEVAEKVFESGFYPDIISGDITAPTYNRRGFCMNLPYVMSKFLALGMPLADVIRACTLTPAMAMKCELGTLAVGAPADICVAKLVNRECRFADRYGIERVGNLMLVPQMTIKDGQIMYCQVDFGG